MGDLRVKVKLTNAIDLVLMRRRTMKLTEVHSYETEGLVDTGCVSLVLPSHVVVQLDLGIAFK